MSANPWLVLVLHRPASMSPDEDRRLRRLLSADEIRRLDAVPTAFARSSFLLGRALLRVCLASLLGRPTREFGFSYSGDGKPGLAPGFGDTPVFFNLSHCRGLVALALSGAGEIGVDVEEVDGHRRSVERHGLQRSESEILARLSSRDRPGGFVQLWTIKEACVKARGGRLADIGAIRATLDSSGHADDVRWWALDVGPRARGAVALCVDDQAEPGPVRHLELSELLETK
ncbi:MAG: 4'-phosphopantetheinyl transferase family protein [Actinomycetota bacterium]